MKRKPGFFRICLFAMLLMLLPMSAHAAPQVITDTSGVADSADYIASDAVGEEGMVPLYAADIKEGSYPIEVDSSSSMFPVPACILTVAEGKLTAEMVMGGHGYLYLFMGTDDEAAAASQDEIASPGENENGKMTFTVEIEALNKPLPCCAFSKNKEKWYERTVVFMADSLPADALLITEEELEERRAKAEEEAAAAKAAAEAAEAEAKPGNEEQKEKVTEEGNAAGSAEKDAAAVAAQGTATLEEARPLEPGSESSAAPGRDTGVWRIPLIIAIILGILFLFWRHRKKPPCSH